MTHMEPMDYYKVLGVEAEEDAEKIKTAYRDLAFRYHPDRNSGNLVAVEKMKQVNEAYAVLSNPEKRREYDVLRRQFGDSAHTRFRKTYSEQDIFSGSDIHHVFEEMAKAFGFRDSEEVLKEFYGKGFRTFGHRRPGFFAGGFIFSGFRGSGGMGQGRVPLHAGPLAMLARHVFKKLTGMTALENGADVIEAITLDVETAEKGGPYAYFHKKEKKKLIVKIPPNVRTGQKIRLVGMGSSGKGGGSPGDLFLKVQVRRPLLDRLKHLISARR